MAVVLTFRRERLATEVVRGLIEREGFSETSVIVVVNGEGGLEDQELARTVRMVHLERNLGPAGGFRVGLQKAVESGARWVYLVEDDIGLFGLPTPRVADLLRRIEQAPAASSIGGVVAYGRILDSRTGRTVPFVPTDDVTGSFPDVDVAAWGATLVRSSVVEQGILPSTEMFFGYEDFDFWLRVRQAGFRLVVDGDIAAEVASKVFFDQREEALRDSRPTDADEPWRMYYEARNFVFLRKRHGTPTWALWHVLMTARRVQLSPSWAHRWAALHGLWDGLRGRTGAHPRYTRGTAERPIGRRSGA